ncbi:MAG: DUF5702 domain-containing protein [Anaerovoracaceae bacterium]
MNVCGKGNKKGTTTVFLCMILSTLLLLVSMLGEATAGMASRSYANSVLDLAGRSILSEYDRSLKSRYGIFGFLMEKDGIEAGMEHYVNESFKTGFGKTRLLPLSLVDIQVDLSEQVMTNPELLKQQILDHMSYRVFFDVLHVLDALELLNDEEGQQTGEGEAENTGSKKMRTLRNDKVIRELPSRLLQGMDGGFKSILEMPLPGEMHQIAYKELCLNLYILKYFRHDLDSSQWNNTFYSNEVEYILCGRLSDEANHNIVYLSLLAYRTMINAAHIYADGDKWEAVTLAATLAGGGVASPATLTAITGIWAGAEAASDMNRLLKGWKVPLIKTAEDWVLDLTKALEGNVDPRLESSEEEEGLSYEDYLFLMLCFKNDESKLIRIMDLIQINLKGQTNEDFAMSRCFSGFRYHSTVVRETGFPGVLSGRSGEFSGTHAY